MKSRKLISTTICALFLCVTLRTPSTSAMPLTHAPSMPAMPGVTNHRITLANISHRLNRIYIYNNDLDPGSNTPSLIALYTHDSDEIYDRYRENPQELTLENEMSQIDYVKFSSNIMHSAGMGTAFISNDNDLESNPQPGVLYYIISFDGDHPTEWVIGKVDYRDCMIRAEYNTAGLECQLSDDGEYRAFRDGMLIPAPINDDSGQGSNPLDNHPGDENGGDDDIDGDNLGDGNTTDNNFGDDQSGDDNSTDHDLSDNDPANNNPSNPGKTPVRKPSPTPINSQTPSVTPSAATVVKNTETDDENTIAPIATTEGGQNLPPDLTAPLQGPATTATIRTYSWWALWPLLALLLAATAYFIYHRIRRDKIQDAVIQ